jgi:hypothetical protein
MSWVRCYGCVLAAQLLWHFIEPWDHCHFITGTIYLGAFLMSSCVVGSWDLSTQEPWNGLTYKLFDSFASGTQHYGWSSHLSMWLDGRYIKLVMANGHGFVAPICILAFWRLHCHDVCGLHCVRSAFLALHSLLVGLFRYQHSVHLSVYSCSANVMIGLLFLRHW